MEMTEPRDLEGERICCKEASHYITRRNIVKWMMRLQRQCLRGLEMPAWRLPVALFLSFQLKLNDTIFLPFMQKHLWKQEVTVASKGFCSKFFKSCQIISCTKESMLTLTKSKKHFDESMFFRKMLSYKLESQLLSLYFRRKREVPSSVLDRMSASGFGIHVQH